MILGRISLLNFRNYKRADFDFSERVNLIVGENAAGKTNLLEAIRFMTYGASHRGASEDELINWGAEHAFIRGYFRRMEESYVLDISISRSFPKRVSLNGVREKRLSDCPIFGLSVIFSPDDLHMLKLGPERRREFMDAVLASVYPSYEFHRRRYFRALAQRNALLRQLQGSGRSLKTALDFWTENLAKEGGHVVNMRASLIAELSTAYKEIAQELLEGLRADLVYKCDVSAGESRDCSAAAGALLRAISDNLDSDLHSGYTQIGPHRDDLVFVIEGRHARYFASQGQQRSLVLALKMAEMRFILQKRREAPLFLLDDVFSELDQKRRSSLSRLLREAGQAIITATDFESVGLEISSEAKVVGLGGPWRS